MNDETTRAEEALRTLLAARAADVPPVDLHAAVVTEARQRRALLGAAVTAVLVLTGVPAALATTDSDTVPALPAATPTPAPAPYCPAPDGPPILGVATVPSLPGQRNVRGSLAGDDAVVRAILVAGYKAIADRGWQDDSRRWRPDTARVLIATAAYDRVFGIVRMSDDRGRAVRALVTGARTDDLDAWVPGSDDGPVELPTTQDMEACGEPYTIVLTRPGATTEVAWATDVRADGSVVLGSTAVPAADGVAVARMPVDKVAFLRVLDSGRTVDLGYPSSSSWVFEQEMQPPGEELDRAVREAPGPADKRAVADGLSFVGGMVINVPVHDPRVLWSGKRADGLNAALYSFTFPSGARLVWENHDGETNYRGILAAGALDRTVFAWRMRGSVAVVATRGARAEAVRSDGSTVAVPLEQGGGILADGGGVRTVRVYDAGGRLIGETAPGAGLKPVQ